MIRHLLTVLLLLVSSLAFARIGLDSQLAQDALEAAGLTGEAAPAGFSVEAEEYGGLLFALSGTGNHEPASLAAIATAVGIATGMGEGIAEPVSGFLNENLEGLTGAGEAMIGIESSYHLVLDVTEDTVSWGLRLVEIDEDLFLPARNFLGAEDGTIVIREFADFQCPHCATFALQGLPMIESELLATGNVRVEFHHLPLVAIHANAVPAAEAVECVAQTNGPEAFWDFSHHVFERQQAWSNLPETASYFISLAQETGFDDTGLSECLSERTFLSEITESAVHATSVLGITGTPTVFLGGFRVPNWSSPAAYFELIDLITAREAAE